MTKEELLEKAKIDYPVGTKFIPTLRAGSITETSSGCFVWDSSRIEDSESGYGIYQPDTGKWAEIISRPEPWEPKVGEWVILESGYHTLIIGRAYKVIGEKDSIDCVLVDHDGDKSYLQPFIHMLRKALPHEIPVEEVEYRAYGIRYRSGFTEGKIYKGVVKGRYFVTIDDNGIETSCVLTVPEKEFIPSTRQAYEAQEAGLATDKVCLFGKNDTSISDDPEIIKITFNVVNNVSQINQKQNEYSKKTIEVCGFDITIGRSDQIRGKSIDYPESEITIGSGYRTDKGRSIEC